MVAQSPLRGHAKCDKHSDYQSTPVLKIRSAIRAPMYLHSRSLHVQSTFFCCAPFRKWCSKISKNVEPNLINELSIMVTPTVIVIVPQRERYLSFAPNFFATFF